MSWSQAARLFNTVRHLRAEQVWYQLLYRASPMRVAPATTAQRRAWVGPWRDPGLWAPAMVAPATFEFLGERGRIVDAADWNDPARTKLWLYNLHYLDDLNAASADDRADDHGALMRRWIDDNPPGKGVGWEPYPLSLRIVNIVKWLSRQSVVDEHCLSSLATQADALARRIEYHLLGNHLFANGKALVFAGAFFSGERAASWLEKGLAILAREVPEQFLSDGGHFERSPMYHATLLVDLLDLVQLSDVSALPALRQQRGIWLDAAVRGLRWLDAMTHPDGEIAFFNDAAFGIAPPPTHLRDYARTVLGNAAVAEPRKPFNLLILSNTGYCRVDLPNDGAAVVDVALLGPDYLPAHGHADTLSFELGLFGTRLFVNSGTSLYGESEERVRQRGTAAHNTVVIDGADSSEIWGGFRVARRARPTLHTTELALKRIVIEASHDGYRRLPGRNTHWRRWTFAPDSLQIDDTITGRFQSAEARYHLHPAIVVQHLDSDMRRAALRLPGGQSALFEVTGAALGIETSSWHPRFGVSVGNRCLTLRFEGGRATTRVHWPGSA
jgi:uncharacterized heparinase superfamily protein